MTGDVDVEDMLRPKNDRSGTKKCNIVDLHSNSTASLSSESRSVSKLNVCDLEEMKMN